MAILRTELVGRGFVSHHARPGGAPESRARGIYDGIVETAQDLFLPRNADFAPGSLMFCMADRCVYVKTGGGSWEAVAL